MRNDEFDRFRFKNQDRVYARLDGEVVSGLVQSQRFTSKRDSQTGAQRHLVRVKLDHLVYPVEFFEWELARSLVDLLAKLA